MISPWIQTFVLPFSLKGAVREFHVSRYARERYALNESLFSIHGQLLLADFKTAQELSVKFNEGKPQDLNVKASDLHAAGLLDEILHLLIANYRKNINTNIIKEALQTLNERFSDEPLEQTFKTFAYLFPATAVFKNEQSLDDYLNAEIDGVPNREVVLEELLMLWISNANPALKPFNELLDDSSLKTTAYESTIKVLKDFFAEQAPLREGQGSLFDMLRAPALASPDSLEGQLRFIQDAWLPILGEEFERLFERLLITLDIYKEEQKMGFSAGGGPPPTHVLDFVTMGSEPFTKRERVEYERFSPDKAWMPRVVMLAKSSYVWLDQLSKSYKQDITRLDQIPDSELDELARRGFTGLWLIGLWERSEASKRIKHLRGQPDAVASAYALYDYQIAHDLGGDAAYEDLRERAWQRGIRLASDMVPNHVGIDARWVVEHPDWFLQVEHPPYPSYSFNGPDLSQDERVGIFLEDHYFDNSDAAVVFKRLDRWSGESCYIYHGNDGTTMPWNDTAQIDYLNAEAREAIIQTILHVARKFPIIRFDAAMTLAKQHIQRLWFPEPGHGGAIPSRSQYGSMRHEDFEAAIPNEFWREVVDRVAEELPDTLLLAEAFWMMEGYFVRTLGMHRVYNSAFMNMLMQEENAKYRQSIKNTLEFDPEIMKRFVNFMNNPDEESAIEQFGNGDKYFGVCLLMSTMPGLPMFGHGQIEGFHEKYGMEYRRAKWEEHPDSSLINRHYHDIFPLLHRRAEFAEVDNFLLYDFYTPEGSINEDVFVYSNNYNGKASLILYNNKFQTAKGWVKRSASYKDKQDNQLKQRDLAEGLALESSDKHFVILSEQTTGLEFLKRSKQLADQGFYEELEAFKYCVYLDIQEVLDIDGKLELLFDKLQGRGVKSVSEELKDLDYSDVFAALTKLITESETSLSDLEGAAKALGLNLLFDGSSAFKRHIKALEKLAAPEAIEASLEADEAALRDYLQIGFDLKPLFTLWALSNSFKNTSQASEALRLARYISKNYGQEQADLFQLLLLSSEKQDNAASLKDLIAALLTQQASQAFLKVNKHEGVSWFNKERYRLLSTSFASTQWLAKEAKGNLETSLKTAYKLELASEYKLAALLAKVPAPKSKSKLRPKKATGASKAKKTTKSQSKTATKTSLKEAKTTTQTKTKKKVASKKAKKGDA